MNFDKRLEKLESRLIPENEMIFQIIFVGPQNVELGVNAEFPAEDVQIAAARARGEKRFMVFSYGER